MANRFYLMRHVRLQTIFSKYKVLFLLSCLYFVIRFYHLNDIPVYNDEAIYLDWGWRELHRPNNLFYSLYDAKPPLLMWLFGLASNLFPNLLLAVRTVSVVFGYLTLLGIWKLSQRVSSTRVASVASLLYITIPIFSFFDRQALMESAMGAIGVWASFATLQLVETRRVIWAMMVGAVLGIGYLIKSNALIFVISSLALLVYNMLFKRKQHLIFFTSILIIFFMLSFIILPMIVQPLYRATLSSNARYALTAGEIMSFPWRHWLSSLVAAVEIIIVHLTLFPSLLLFAAIMLEVLRRRHMIFFVLQWFLITVGLDIFLARGIIERYLVSFLPLATVLISILLHQITRRTVRMAWLFLMLVTTAMITLLQIISPLAYFALLSRISPFALREYTTGITSGYGVPEAVQYLNHVIAGSPAYVATALHTGNPESGIMTAFMNSRYVNVAYLDAQFSLKNHNDVDCLSSSIPIYFVSREDDTAGLGRFLVRIYFARNPVSGVGIGIYTLKQSCTGKTLQLFGHKT